MVLDMVGYEREGIAMPHTNHKNDQYDYERLARMADRRLGLYARETIDEAIEFAHLSGTEAVLDTCCGNGELLQYVALKGHRGPLVGVDFSPAILNVAALRLKTYATIVLKQEDIGALSQPSDYFHIVFNTNAFRYLKNPEASLSEFYRVLRPHGRLILVDLAATSWLMRVWVVLRRILRPTYRRLYWPEEISQYLHQAGFVLTRRKLWRVNLFWSVMLFEAQKPAPASSQVVSAKQIE